MGLRTVISSDQSISWPTNHDDSQDLDLRSDGTVLNPAHCSENCVPIGQKLCYRTLPVKQYELYPGNCYNNVSNSSNHIMEISCA